MLILLPVACSGRPVTPRAASGPGPTSTSGPALTDPPPTVSPTTVVPTTPLRATTTTRPPVRRAAPDLDAYRGWATWIDVFDWSRTYGTSATVPEPAVGPGEVDRMADAGVQTLFVQTAHWDNPADVLEPDHLRAIIARAHLRRLRVVAWYLPTLEDPATDLRRLVAAAGLGVEGIAVDVESRKVDDVAERNRRLVALGAALRRSLPGRAIGAIVLPPVVLDLVNPAYWPGFPWAALVPSFDVWLPMAYWTNRTADSGWRDARHYTAENVARLRRHLGLPGAPVHVIGGIADQVGTADVVAMEQAAVGAGALGAGLYDWRTTSASLWPALAPLRWKP